MGSSDDRDQVGFRACQADENSWWPLIWLCCLYAALCAPGPVFAGEVRIEGLEGEMLSNAEKYLSIYQHKDDQKLSVRWRRHLHEEAPTQIREALQPFGYYNVEVDGKLNEDPDGWRAVYRVVLGRPVRVVEKNIRWVGEGAQRPALQAALDKFPLKLGQRFVDQRYEDGKEALQDAAYELGYVKVKARRHQVNVNPDANTADIELVMDTGPLYRFGEITLHQDVLSPALLQHYVSLEPGRPYSNRELIEFQQQLAATGWFEIVDVKPNFGAARDAIVPIGVYLTPAKRHQLDLGLGFATDIGVRGSVRWTNNRVNRWGHQAGASMQLAQTKGTVSANYKIPVVNPLTDRLAFTSTYEYENLNDTDRDTVYLDAAFLRTTLDQKNFFKLFGEFRYERFSSGEEGINETNLLSAGGIIRRTVAKPAEFLRRGYSATADLRVASSALISDTSFVRGDFSGSYLHPLGERGRLNLRGEVGLAWVEHFDAYPNSLRYFAGGDQSIRGYGYKELGPSDDSGSVIGGRNLLVGSLEYEQRIVGKWVGAGFVDAGNAYNAKLDKVYVGAGFGVRWLFPFGSARLDLAWPVSEDPSLKDVRLHFGLGAVL